MNFLLKIALTDGAYMLYKTQKCAGSDLDTKKMPKSCVGHKDMRVLSLILISLCM